MAVKDDVAVQVAEAEASAVSVVMVVVDLAPAAVAGVDSAASAAADRRPVSANLLNAVMVEAHAVMTVVVHRAETAGAVETAEDSATATTAHTTKLRRPSRG